MSFKNNDQNHSKNTSASSPAVQYFEWYLDLIEAALFLENLIAAKTAMKLDDSTRQQVAELLRNTPDCSKTVAATRKSELTNKIALAKFASGIIHLHCQKQDQISDLNNQVGALSHHCHLLAIENEHLKGRGQGFQNPPRLYSAEEAVKDGFDYMSTGIAMLREALPSVDYKGILPVYRPQVEEALKTLLEMSECLNEVISCKQEGVGAGEPPQTSQWH